MEPKITHHNPLMLFCFALTGLALRQGWGLGRGRARVWGCHRYC